MFCSIEWAETAHEAVLFNVCANRVLVIFRKSWRPPRSGSSELLTFMQGCLRAFCLLPVIFFSADARCPFVWDTYQNARRAGRVSALV